MCTDIFKHFYSENIYDNRRMGVTSTLARLSCYLPKSFTRVKTLCFWMGGQEDGVKKKCSNGWMAELRGELLMGHTPPGQEKKVDDCGGCS